MKELKEAIKLYRQLKKQNKEKSRLISAPFNGAYFQGLLESVAAYPNRVKIIIKLKNGEEITIKQDVQEEQHNKLDYTKYIE